MMNEFYEKVGAAAAKGLVDSSVDAEKALVPRILQNNKATNEKVLSTICEKLEVCTSFKFAVAFLTSSGVASIQNSLKVFQKNNSLSSGTIIVSDYLNFTEPAALKKLMKMPNVDLYLLKKQNFHGKGYLIENVDGYDLVLGSSNLTAPALTINEELNLHISATKDAGIIEDFIQAYQKYLSLSQIVTEDVLAAYIAEYDKAKTARLTYRSLSNSQDLTESSPTVINALSHQEHRSKEDKIRPNLLQIEATEQLSNLRSNGSDRALIISATGTGKTVLSALDAKAFNARRVLFVVHRHNIASKALATFKKIFGESRSYGMYSGSKNEINKDFLFSTVQTINAAHHLTKFSPDHFDYIIIDETHRAGAMTYQKILDYFQATFTLGMTATPERTDGYDIFSLFNHNVGSEIRLHRALEENLLCPFHYFGISDLIVDGKEIDELSEFNQLASEERVNHIISALNEHGTDSGSIRGLIFCSRIEESGALSYALNEKGFRTIALSGKNTEKERELAMARLESDGPDQLDYILTVDIFNEGIDIPSLNQVVMLRPTQSPIIFVQQLGRGLRKSENKDYLTIIDFIGNYKNNYMVPIALYGDNSLSKDTLRKLVSSGSSILPGSSTVNFDAITKEKIFESINTANLQTKKSLQEAYRQQKFRQGRIPMMMDFFRTDSRDAFQYVAYSRSYYNFVLTEETGHDFPKLSSNSTQLLEHLSKYVNDGVRGFDSFLISEVIHKGEVKGSDLIDEFMKLTGIKVDNFEFVSSVNSVNLLFHQERQTDKFEPIGKTFNYQVVKSIEDSLSVGSTLAHGLKEPGFRKFLLDSCEFSLNTFLKKLNGNDVVGGFIRYEKYTRIDVIRVLGWSTHPVPLQNVGGYKISPDASNCPIFVTYHKKDTITDTTKYEDEFLSAESFSWMSRSKRTLTSGEVATIIAQRENGIRLPLFIKKSDDEGQAHYYIGDLSLVDGSPEVKHMPSGEGKEVSVVNMQFKIDKPVETNLYNFLCNT